MSISAHIIEAIGHLFEQVNGNTLEPYEIKIFKDHKLDNQDSDSLVSTLTEEIISNGSLSDKKRRSIYWVLSKRQDSL